MKIVVFSDGTGNSSAKLFRTNVWRLYDALDLKPDADQVAYYDNGVGTAAFKPFAVLGGAFGWGLKRNVLDIYTFICRNHAQPGPHEIYAFGFSRGAFTIRVLLGLMRRQGLVPYHGDERDLKRLATWAYRMYRHEAAPSRGLVGSLRWLRDWVLAAFDRVRGKAAYRPENNRKDGRVRLVGLWDTVAAYGFPIIEMTRGWDRWIWPLSLPTRQLSEMVDKACHALALDDERQTFHPLLWDESGESTVAQWTATGMTYARRISDERVSQVWFAGMHSNVGGGYPDDGMAYDSLCWIAEQAIGQGHGIRLKPGVLDEWARRCTPSAPIADSRHGLGAYYRYLPRLVETLGNDSVGNVHVSRPKIHASVLRRIGGRIDGYAPLGLPATYAVTDGDVIVEQPTRPPLSTNDGPGIPLIETAAQAERRRSQQEVVWDAVWFRRVAYFLTVVSTCAVLSFPFLPTSLKVQIVPWPLETLSNLIGLAGEVLPGWFSPFLIHFRQFPLQLVIGGGIVLALMTFSTWIQRRIDDTMRRIWRGDEPPSPSVWLRAARSLRLAPWYTRLLDTLRYTVAPHAFGLLMLVVLTLTLVVTSIRLWFDVPMLTGRVCRDAPVGEVAPVDTHITKLKWFDTRNLCQAMGVFLEQGHEYEITVTPSTLDWKDGTLPVTNLKGFPTHGLVFYLALPLRRHRSLDWFVPVARVGAYGDQYYAITKTPTRFRPQIDGQLFLYVNDALSVYPSTHFYDNNWNSEDPSAPRFFITRIEGP